MTTIGIGCIIIDAHLYLEGSLIEPQTGQYLTEMRTDLNDARLLPGQFVENSFGENLYSPVLGVNNEAYSGGPWRYSGAAGNAYDSQGMTANVAANYPAGVVDWVLVSLRSDPENGGEVLCQRPALLFNDGHIEFVADSDCCDLDPSQTYYLVIEHRNHLVIMSHTALPIVNGVLTYDFRNKQSYILDPLNSGGFFGQIEITPGVYAMYAGNGEQELSNGDDQDTDINASDSAKLRNGSPASRSYKLVDYNMDGDVSALDLFLWRKNAPKVTSVKRQ